MHHDIKNIQFKFHIQTKIFVGLHMLGSYINVNLKQL